MIQIILILIKLLSECALWTGALSSCFSTQFSGFFLEFVTREPGFSPGTLYIKLSQAAKTCDVELGKKGNSKITGVA